MENKKTSNKKLLRDITIILSVLIMLFLINSFGTNAFASEVNTGAEFKTAFNNLAGLLNKIAAFMLGISVLSGIGTTVYHLIRLGNAGSNPQARAKIIQDMITTGICIALLGSVNLAVSLVTMWF